MPILYGSIKRIIFANCKAFLVLSLVEIFLREESPGNIEHHTSQQKVIRKGKETITENNR